MFRVGQRVVCIRDDWYSPTGNVSRLLPIKDKIYTILDIHYADYFPNGMGLRLNELDHSCSFCSSNFRPLIDDSIEEMVTEIEKTFIQEPEPQLA